MKLWKTNDPHLIITKKCQKQFRGPFFIFWVLTERGRLEAVQRPRRTVGPNVKNPSKMRFKIFVKLTQIILVPLTIWQVLIRKRKLFENAETWFSKNLWNHFGWTYFWRFLVIWNPLCVAVQKESMKWTNFLRRSSRLDSEAKCQQTSKG